MDSNLRRNVSRTPSSSSVPQGPTSLGGMHQYGMPQYQVSQAQTLPPLQPHQMNPMGSHNFLAQPFRPEMSRYPSASGPPLASDRYTPTSHVAPQSTIHSLPPSSFLAQPGQQFPTSQNFLPTTSAAQSYPQPIAPAPPRDTRSDLNSLPPASFSQAENKAGVWSAPENLPSSSAFAPKDQGRTHVVGSQGRRGILPSAPGRAAAVGNGVNGNSKNAAVPAKDAEGKFPCPHCNKTYLHAKHLKRHLLRRE